VGELTVPLKRPCLDCGTRTQGSRCAACQHQRDHTRQHASGRNTYHWQQLREQRKRLDGYRCTYCGSTDDLTVDYLGSRHLHGNHRIAAISDCVTACRSCNSRRGAGARARAERRPA
jgi:5-methylcytosine-specific restriction endonuclease McrA